MKPQFVVRDLEIIAATMLALGYFDVGVIELTNREFTLTLRGPAFWRLSAGLPPYLHGPSSGVGAKAYLRIEALLAYLLLVGEAVIRDASVASSISIWTISSKWFRWGNLQKLIENRGGAFRYRRSVVMLFNTAIGLGLMLRRLPFVLTGVAYDRNLMVKFFTSAAPLQRTRRRLPSKLTLPLMNAKLHWLGVIVGGLMITQQLRVVSLLMERGGLIGLGITGDVLMFKVLPQWVRKKVRSTSSQAEM